MSGNAQSCRAGQAGVLRVASELMFRGLDVLMPAVDSGVDLYVAGGTRIQVKTSTVLNAWGCASFMLSSGYRMTRAGRIQPAARIFSERCEGVSPGCVRQLVRSENYGKSVANRGRSLVAEINKHEGDWESIGSHAKLMPGENPQATIDMEVYHP